MAIEYATFETPIARNGRYPLDVDTVFYNYTETEFDQLLFAENSVFYPGQIVSVVNSINDVDCEIKTYVIQGFQNKRGVISISGKKEIGSAAGKLDDLQNVNTKFRSKSGEIIDAQPGDLLIFGGPDNNNMWVNCGLRFNINGNKLQLIATNGSVENDKVLCDIKLQMNPVPTENVILLQIDDEGNVLADENGNLIIINN